MAHLLTSYVKNNNNKKIQTPNLLKHGYLCSQLQLFIILMDLFHYSFSQIYHLYTKSINGIFTISFYLKFLYIDYFLFIL